MSNQEMIFFQNYNYDLCLAKDNLWTVAEAVDYLAAYLTNKESWSATEEAAKAYPFIRHQLFNAAKQSIDAGSLLVGEVYKESSDGEENAAFQDMDFTKSTVRPFVFIHWAIDNKFEVPEQFADYVAMKKGDQIAYYEGFGLKRCTVHHERCRAIAELLWSMLPDMTIADMARRREITEYGCEGYPYDVRTICRWLASLIDVRTPGRRRKWDS